MWYTTKYYRIKTGSVVNNKTIGLNKECGTQQDKNTYEYAPSNSCPYWGRNSETGTGTVPNPISSFVQVGLGDR